MADSYFDNLTDVELRQELQKYGFPIMPVTETTRSLLIKKLKSHVLNDSTSQKSAINNRRSLQSNKSISKRQPSPNKRSNASPSRRQTTSPTYTNNNKSILENSATSNPSNSIRDYFLSSDGRSYLNRDYENFAIDRNCASHQTLADNAYSFSPSNSKLVSSSNHKSSPKIYVPPPILSSDINCNSSSVDGSRSSSESDKTPQRNGKETPSVVSRLLKLRDITIGRSHINTSYAPSTPKYFYISDSDSDNGSPTRCSSSFNRRYNNSITDNLWAHLNIRNKFKQSSVPYLLISCFGLFFLVLAVLYMTKPPDMPSTMLEKSTTFALCEETIGHTSSLAKPSVNCINNELLEPSLAFNKELIQLLQTNIETHHCKDSSVSPEITNTEFMKYLYKKRPTDAHKLLKSFHSALYLIEHNPQWKIQILRKREEQQLPDIYREDIQFRLVKPYLPLKCILYNKMQRFFVIIGSVFLVAIIIGIGFILCRFWTQRRQLRLKIVDNFTKEIVKELVQRASYKDDAQGELIINHLRDKLIPLNKRKTLLWAWNEALQKLEAGDSRIQFGCILQNGEEFRTMKWVESTVSVPSNSLTSPPLSLTNNFQFENSERRLKRKHWQSPAFDNVNKINDPPTPCLKIRHMFDASEANSSDLKLNIIASILEKVGLKCRIYDIQLDRQSCCVYIRCASEKDAGIVHNEINGWWFDNRLVSIKFLRLQRYLVRFPDSTSIVPITIKNLK